MKIYPVYTEKSMANARENNVYTFAALESDAKISKDDISEFIKKSYKVEPQSIRSNVRLGKIKRFNNSKKSHKRKDIKFFYVKLKENDTITEFKLDDQSK